MNDWIIYAAIFSALLVIDFIFTHGREISVRRSLSLTAWYIAASIGFSGFIYYARGAAPAAQYLTVFSLEKMLSMDNLLVIFLIFQYFGITKKQQHSALLWGISGAIFFRTVLIASGVALLDHLSWVLYLFAAFLVYSGGKIMFGGDDEAFNPGESCIVSKLFRSNFGRFAAAIIAVELCDIMFAVDSIPASFGVSQDPYIIITANLMAVLGLRALYHAVAAGIEAMKGIEKYIGAVLMLVGFNVLGKHVNFYLSDIQLMVSIFLILGTGTFMCRSKKTLTEGK